VLIVVWLLLTPVAYSLPAAGRFAQFVRWNPVTPVLVTTRELATGAPLSEPGGFLLVGFATMLSLIGAWLAVRLAMPIVIQRMGA
jgi:lipopolysaccharide transport system permease protein